MLIIPAIDLQSGRCVRLKQGKFDQVTEFNDDPVERAFSFANAKAGRMHIVDLDGARTGQMQQFNLIKTMQQASIPIQAGGGIRSLHTAKLCLEAGIDYLVIGSLAITEPELTVQMINELSADKIVLALDVRVEGNTPFVATHGWQDNSKMSLWQTVDHYQSYGITQILCTDIACDGMMSGPNLGLYQQALERFPNIEWQASGGIRDKQDIHQLKSMGISAAILGLALYQDKSILEELLLC
ncbi:1-(5-phosphoribosyl)-5-[(5-phosphoribosylamino)methylideneamino]imidazole-4-carboxamide isomerase [Legionella waltersii]|uniref:1-(5-phosphoribosyl)-5-[(5-phosphoribosylamino)methylideneamino] imidazole-4-carboxamide isomerase n=1 Tax=Legionella waltersii TaxID=66969 RepID=A0A0W1AN30_9GAMM|nr:1-(5-phosphoribosyl)-5-[(5-phosphoribosylamino)methylideneamino]imidazole-4-carboxamide isomerase [Legionella waltersii]KTD82686.1 phosphoribosylformimino-5-aminoimidazole carboxamide ribotide isomerase [Legionella waltersii]SNV03306.1 phosphoribosylformimino-5-aminoimidazole carboxamide ribotide isomerase [Legionella waltersii]